MSLLRQRRIKSQYYIGYQVITVFVDELVFVYRVWGTVT